MGSALWALTQTLVLAHSHTLLVSRVLGSEECAWLFGRIRYERQRYMKRERSPDPPEADISNGAAKTARFSPEDSPKRPVSRRTAAVKSGAECPYLNTVSRQVQ